MGCVGSGNKLQKQKKGPWSLGKRSAERTKLGGEEERLGVLQRDTSCTLGKEGGGESKGLLKREKEPFVLRVFIWRSQRRLSIEYSSAFQMCPFRVIVSTDQGTGSLVIASGSDVSHAQRCSIWFCCFLGPGAETELRPRSHR